MKNIISVTILFIILSFCQLFAAAKVVPSLSIEGSPKLNSSITLKVDFAIPEDMHIYANYEQEMGLPTELNLELPQGFELKSSTWSEPKEFVYADMKSTGYSNHATATFDIYINDKAKTLNEIIANISWLECSDSCDVGEVSLKQSVELKEQSIEQSKKQSIFLLALMAFLGGMILNLMPCVFPIIGIKVLSFIKGASGEKSKAILSALSYSLGIVLSFLALAGLLIIFKAMGIHYGWGFQLQEPIFVALMILLFFAIALSFSGLFEVGASLGNLGNNSNKNHNEYIKSFLSGVLAVLVASPCTAPYMATAVGAVLIEDFDIVRLISIFTCLGLGMAFPYLFLTLIPALHKFLPKSGNWLNTFKEFLAFLLYATCIWLFWVFIKQTNPDSATLLLFSVLLLSLALFIYGKWQAPHFSKLCRYSACIVSILLIALSIYTAKIASIDKAQEAPTSLNSNDEATQALDKLAQLRANGETVFVDFTASWCVTCQSNKKLVLDTQATKELFAKHNIKLLRIDWTKRNPIIAQELEKFGSIGVPLYLLYHKNSQNPIILPNILTYSILEKAINNL